MKLINWDCLEEMKKIESERIYKIVKVKRKTKYEYWDDKVDKFIYVKRYL